MTLRVEIAEAGALHDVHLDVQPGVTAVIGPNGAGKSTLLRVIAGLLNPNCLVAIDQISWRGLPAWERSVGLVPQERDLFPHLDLLDNVAFGARSRGARKGKSRELAMQWLERLGIGELAHRRPHQISGGEAQRVAIGRALAINPAVLALDEPFASLDVGVAEDLRKDLAPYLADRVTVLVTHDPIDLRELADAAVVLDEGRVIQSGTLTDVAQTPGSTHAARITGANVLRGVSTGTRVVLDSGTELITSSAQHGPVLLTFPATAVTLSLNEPHGSARNVWASTVRRISVEGHTARVHLDPPGITADLTSTAAAELALAVGTPVFAALKATEVRVFGAA